MGAAVGTTRAMAFLGSMLLALISGAKMSAPSHAATSEELDAIIRRSNENIQRYNEEQRRNAPPVPTPTITTVSAQSEANLSDEFYLNQAAAIAKYSNWQRAPATFTRVEFQQGKYVVQWQEIPTTFEHKNNQRIDAMNRNFQWSDWFAASRDTAFQNVWTIVCLFNAGDGAVLGQFGRGDVKRVSMKIQSAAAQRLVFDCRL